MVPGYKILIIIFILVNNSLASICTQGKQYLSTKLETCVNCTECSEGDVVLRPCEIHRDTLCGPISELLKFMQTGNNINTNNNNNNYNNNINNRNLSPNYHAQQQDIIWKYGDDVQNYDNNNNIDDIYHSSTDIPYSNGEKLIWDWQTFALTLAIFACLLFFLIISLYSLHQAKQWRRLKDNFEADVEELSTRLSLMTAENKNELLESHIRHTTLYDTNYLNNKCIYLEQLLNIRHGIRMGMKNEKGNVYIEENSPNPTINLKL